jgi:hypothetical protein
MALALESTGARMSRLGTCVLNELPILSVEELIERIDSVDIPALKELAGKLLSPARLSVAGVGPDEDAFRGAIEPLQRAESEGGDERSNGASPRLAARVAER